MLVDPEAVIEARREARHSLAAVDAQEARRWLAMHRGDRWPIERIAAFLGLPEALIAAGIAQAREADVPMRFTPKSHAKEPSL